MTQLQKLAWLNLIFFPLLLVVIVLGEFGVFSDTVEYILIGLLLVVTVVAMAFMAKMPWHKETVEDERDRRFRQRSFAAAYFVLLSGLSVGLVGSIIAFPEGQVPSRLIAGGVGIAFVASMLWQSVALLIQYKKGARENS